MRAWLAIFAAILTACAAEPGAEAQINDPISSSPSFAQDQDTVTQRRGAILRTAIANFGNNPDDAALRDAKAALRKTYNLDLTDRNAALRDELFELHQKYVSSEMTVTPLVRPDLFCHGIAKQGGLVVCQTAPNARVEVGRSENDTYMQTADKNGVLLVGFDRDEPAAFVRFGEQRVNFDIKPRSYDVSRIDGLPKNMVSEYTPEEIKRIRKASALKKVGFASKVEEVGFKDGFIFPVTDHIKTTNFGAQRILNGDPKRPHFGVDLAAPKGTPILAPADGIVSLASEEMYFDRLEQLDREGDQRARICVGVLNGVDETSTQNC